MLKLQNLLILLALVCCSNLEATDKPSFQAYVPRGGDLSSIRVDLTVNNIEASDVLDADVRTVVLNRVRLYIIALGNGPLRFADSGSAGPTESDASRGAEVSFADSVATLEAIPDDPNGRKILKVGLKIAVSDSSRAKTKEDNKDIIKIKVAFLSGSESGATEGNSSEVKASEKDEVVSVAPENFKSVPTHKSLKLSWDKKDKVKYNNNTEQAPAGTTIFLFDLEDYLSIGTVATESGIPAKVYKKNKQDETSLYCSISVGNDNTTCQIDCDQTAGEVYVDTAENAFSHIRTGFIGKFSSSSTAESFTRGGLDPSRSYLAFAQYMPDGLARSNCVIGQPTENYTLSELNNKSTEAKQGDAHCFIATAAYGSALSPEVQVFRAFRDRVLLRSSVGQGLVAFYYQVSPPLAAYISTSPLLRSLTRGLLWIPLGAIKYPGWALVSFLSGCGLWFWLRRRLLTHV